MNWSPQQERVLQMVSEWKRRRAKPYFTLAGFAGTGKTTLAKQLASDVEGIVYFAAYTGKAAHVLRQTGIPNTSTIHQLIYLPRYKCDARLTSLRSKHTRLLKRDPPPTDAEIAALEEEIACEVRNLNRPEFTLNNDSPLKGAKLLVIDEYSMVDQQTGIDLLSFDCPVLALGDPGQLPPVQGSRFFNHPPDFMLTEIHRQAADNPIIKLSKEVREGRRLLLGEYGSSKVVRRKDVVAELGPLVLGADQVLVGLNESRREFNRYMRELQGRKTPLPVAGDKLVCLRNNHQDGMLNGQTWTVVHVSGTKHLRLALRDDDDRRATVLSHPNHFEGTEANIDPRRRRDANEFDFGYALTVHKSQGSQWNNVVLIDEWRSSNRAQWLYTGITRAAQSITIVQ